MGELAAVAGANFAGEIAADNGVGQGILAATEAEDGVRRLQPKQRGSARAVGAGRREQLCGQQTRAVAPEHGVVVLDASEPTGRDDEAGAFIDALLERAG